MKKDKVRVRTYLPRKVYVELHKRYMYDHLPFLLEFLLEGFLETGVHISWEEMPTKAEQKQYLERKLREFLSGKVKGEYPQERILEKAETVPSSPEVKKEEKKEEVRAEDREEMEDEELRRKRKEEFLKRYEQFW